jgi:hypothetical protein
MPNYVNLTREDSSVLTGKDGIIIRKRFFGLEAGRVLNLDQVEGAPAYTQGVVPCGLPVITRQVEGEPTYKPLAPTEGFVLPAGWSYAGLAGATVKSTKSCPIVIAGVVNEVALLEHLKEIFDISNRVLTVADLAPLKAALPQIMFVRDEAYDTTLTRLDGAVLLDSQESFTEHFAMLADYYRKNPSAPGHDGTYPGDPWVVVNFSGLSGTLTVVYDGAVKATVPGITPASTYIILSPAADLGLAEGFDLAKLSLAVRL